MRRIWVVEIKFEDTDKWEATVGVALTREVGREVLREWQTKHVAGIPLRLRPYEAEQRGAR